MRLFLVCVLIILQNITVLQAINCNYMQDIIDQYFPTQDTINALSGCKINVYPSTYTETLDYLCKSSPMYSLSVGFKNANVITSPFPWSYLDPDTQHTLSFAHNGTIGGAITSSNPTMSGECLEMKNYVVNYLLTHTDAHLSELVNEDVDSGIYFAYLITHIKEENWDILRGLSDALAGKYVSEYGTTGYNFALTDGYDLYAYRNYNTSTNNLYMIYLRRNYSNANYSVCFVTTSLDHLSTTSILRQNAVAIENNQLVYIPSKGRIVKILNFSTTSDKGYMKYTTPVVAPATSVWNWESFPIMRGISDDACQTYSQAPATGFTYSNHGFIHGIQGIDVYTHKANHEPSGLWDYPALYAPYTITPKQGYKIQSSAQDDAIINGTLCDNTPYGSLSSGITYWIGYWLMNSQSLQDAFGSNFSKVLSAKCDNWYYEPIPENPTKTGISGDPLPSVDNCTRPMEFGKMYAITLKPGETITNFQWDNSRKPATGNFNLQSNFFSYNSAADYEVVDVINVSKAILPYKEIGVFDGETCIGATAVEQYPVQILLYTEGHEGHTLTFRGVTENGLVTEVNPVVQSYDTKSGRYEDKMLVAGEVGYQITKMEEKSISNDGNVPAMVSSHSIYPNPFNPTTTIQFSLTATTHVNISIYDCKGRKVKSLLSGEVPSGKHFMPWNGTDNNNQKVSSGIYFCQIEAGSKEITQKMVLMK